VLVLALPGTPLFTARELHLVTEEDKMKRFIDSEIWKTAWFRKLSPAQKSCYFYMISNCDHAGIFEVDIETVEFFIGDEVGDPHKFLADNFAIVKINESKWFLIDFLRLQYPRGLNSEKPAIVSVKNRLGELNLSTMIAERFGNDYLIIKDKRKDKREDQDEDKKEEEVQEENKDKTGTSSELTETLPKNVSLNEEEFEKLKKMVGEKKCAELIEKLSLIKSEFDVNGDVSDFETIIEMTKKEYVNE